MTKRIAGLTCCALMLVVLASCSKKSDTTANPTASAPVLSNTPQPTACSLDGADTVAKTKDAAGVSLAPVADVRHTSIGCPRIVFEFTGHLPGYTVAYADPPFSECGSGADVNTSEWGAKAVINIKLTPSGSVDDKAKQTYTGPRDIAVNGQVLRHLRSICDFEADYQWVAGLDAKHPFKVTTFQDPPRLVIDISEN